MPRCYLVKKAKYFGIRDWGQLTDVPPTSPSEASVAPNSPSYTQLNHVTSASITATPAAATTTTTLTRNLTPPLTTNPSTHHHHHSPVPVSIRTNHNNNNNINNNDHDKCTPQILENQPIPSSRKYSFICSLMHSFIIGPSFTI